MRRLIAASLCLVLMLAVSGCGETATYGKAKGHPVGEIGRISIQGAEAVKGRGPGR